MEIAKIKAFLARETVLCVALFLGCASSFLRLPSYRDVDWGVLSILSALMLVVAGLKSIKFLDYIAIRMVNSCRSQKQLILVLVGITFFASMLVTNDVALLTFVPLTLVIGKQLRLDVAQIIIIQTLAANLGSMFTPMGNPQNLFLYAHYAYTPWNFFKLLLIPTLLAVVYLLMLIDRRRNQALSLELNNISPPKQKFLLLYGGLLLLNIGAVLHLIDKYFSLGLTCAVIFLVQRKLFRQIDFSLLMTFIGFFVFIANISQTGWVHLLQQSVLGTATGTYLVALISSQFISNVPAAMLLAGLTQEADALLLGVNIGGLGTLIASMASVISYKLFIGEHPSLNKSYLKMFAYYNFLGLLLLGAAVYGYMLTCI